MRRWWAVDNDMPPVLSVINQFRGINPHLHSRWQEYGDWPSFHAAHINDIMRLLNIQLRPRGYRADLEQSIQLWRSEKEMDEPRADVVIYETQPARSAEASGTFSAPVGVLVLDLAETLQILEEPYEYMAIAIVPFKGGERGEPVAWIELLSPSNKVNAPDRRAYQRKRRDLVHQQIAFIELDYLHLSPPTIARLPRYYRKGKIPETGAAPYRIVVMNPHPSLASGETTVYPFFVDEPIPAAKIPLSAGDWLEFDFNAPYQRTFEEVFYGDGVDYSQFPVNFESYSPDDRARILSRMLAVIRARQSGDKLEIPPQPIATLPLETALQQYQSLL